MAFSNLEKAKIRAHLGFMNVGFSGSFFYNLPRPTQTAFLIEEAMAQVLPEGEGIVRELIGRLDATEEQMFKAQERMAASRLGEITMNEKEMDMLQQSYIVWANRLADTLGVPLYPYSRRFSAGQRIGNIPVS